MREKPQNDQVSVEMLKKENTELERSLSVTNDLLL